MKTLYFELLCGAGGDMILSSLIDLGVPLEYLQKSFERLPIEGLCIDSEKIVRSGITCVQLKMSWSEQKRYRHLPDIFSIIRGGGYSNRVEQNCEKILLRIARAEAKVHGIALEKVHFHEIGAIDTIIDVLGASLACEYLGVESIQFSTLTVGQGVIDCAHGQMPVPVPATAEMIQGYASKTLDIDTEILTPTGCAILTALGTQSPSRPRGKAAGLGYGTGQKDFGRMPNIIRAHLIETDTMQQHFWHDEEVTVLETDMDHISGEIMAYTAERLYAGGALDVSWMSMYMKKGRPGYRLHVICRESDRQALMSIVFDNTRTLGIRYDTCRRAVLPRAYTKGIVRGQEVEVKKCTGKDREFTKIEYEGLAAIARRFDIPLIDLYEEYGRKTTPDQDR